MKRITHFVDRTPAPSLLPIMRSQQQRNRTVRSPFTQRAMGVCRPLGQERVADLDAVVVLAWVEIL